ncbi:MAG: hypothetical protein LBF83_11395, partial [Spirochaetaceae bacterium]|nr:hypothetical protein [Spirochaetaceae bacterium]
SVQEAHDIYRKKDVVEKAFMRYKDTLGMGRLRVHDGERMRNKMLVSFISLVLVSAIHKVMKEKGRPIWRNTPQSTARESVCAPYVSIYCVKKVTE